MSDHLLTLNAGSSSIKYALFERDGAAALFSGQIDGIGVANGSAVATYATHEQALAEVLVRLAQRNARVGAIGHRIVHGGMLFVRPVRIDDAVLAQIAALADLAPLH
ncbi:MAG: acetate kinase, partial [Rhizobacter sp.]